MELKRVSYKVAKYLKDAGYPQNYGEGSIYYSEDGKTYEYDSELYPMFPEIYCICPNAMEIWLWLWREKKIWIEVLNFSGSFLVYINKKPQSGVFNDPEDAIIAAIEGLIDNKLLE